MVSLLPLPLLFSTWWADFDRPYRVDQNIALAGLNPDEIGFPSVIFDRHHPSLHDRTVLDLHYPSWMNLLRRKEGTTGIVPDKDQFKVVIDVQQFKPEEISVKVVDRCVVVEAKHEEKKDEHGSISRQFLRKYLLPNRVDLEQLSSTLSSDGVLTITAPLKKEPDEVHERVIEIKLTGKPALRPSTEDEGPSTTESSVTTSTEKKNIADNEIREELTTQAQEKGAKPEK